MSAPAPLPVDAAGAASAGSLGGRRAIAWTRSGVRALTALAASRLWVLIGIGAALSIVMVARSQVGGDQLNLLARGWLLAKHGVWIAYGNRTSAGGYEPGGLTSVLVGLPLLVWSDYRAPTVLIALLGAAGYALLDGVVADAGTAAHRRLFAVAYWLNPWRLFFATNLWNPNYLLFFAAVHLATAYRMRIERRFSASAVHAAALLWALQLHPSALILVIASGVLVWRRMMVIHRVGTVCGAAIGAATLVPYFVRAADAPAIVPGGGDGFIGRGLIFVFPLLRGLLYWLRYASFAISEKMANLDFAPALGAAARPMELVLAVLQYAAGPLSLAAAVAANLWLLRRLRRRGIAPSPAPLHWVQGYVGAVFVGAVVSFALSPTTIMPWQCLPCLHAAVLPLVLWTALLRRTPLRASADTAVRSWLVIAVVLSIAIAFGAPLYRSGGRKPEAVPLRDHPMLADVGLADQSASALQAPHGAVSDVLTYDDAR